MKKTNEYRKKGMQILHRKQPGSITEFLDEQKESPYDEVCLQGDSIPPTYNGSNAEMTTRLHVEIPISLKEWFEDQARIRQRSEMRSVSLREIVVEAMQEYRINRIQQSTD